MKEVHITFGFEGSDRRLMIYLHPMTWNYSSIPREEEFMVLSNFIDDRFLDLGDKNIKKIHECKWIVHKLTWTGPGKVTIDLREW